MKKIKLLYDAIRSPYDIAHVIQIALALDCEIYTAGNSIPFDNKKIVDKIRSWNITSYPKVTHFETFEQAVNTLRSEGNILVGTSGAATKSFYELDCSEGNIVIVFGNESSGLTTYKQSLLDELVKLPMNTSVDFLTLPVVTAAIAYEINRQFYF